MQFYDQKGASYQLDRVLGKGGEATIWTVKWCRRLVAKIYRQPRADRESKLRTMIAAPPVDPARKWKHASICWPQTLLFDQNRRLAGFLMPRIDMRRHRELFRISTPSTRLTEAPGFTWDYLVAAAENIALLCDSLHRAGYVIGDLNESNLFISDNARASIVDCDSIQVIARGDVFRCTVAKAEFLAPELHGADFSTRVRTCHEDHFALAVLIFQLLMEGVHPYSGRWRAPGEPPALVERIMRGDTPYAGSPRILPSTVAPPFEMLPADLQQLFVRAFLHGNRDPSWRPSALEWHRGLNALRAQMTTCSLNSQHRFSSHLPRCPWCDRAAACGFDAYPARCTAQLLPAVPRLHRSVESRQGVRAVTNGGRPLANGTRRKNLKLKTLGALAVVGPFLSAALSAMLSGPGGADMIRETAVLAALIQCARAVQLGRFRRAAGWLASAFIIITFANVEWPHTGAVGAAVEALIAFFTTRCLLAMLKTTLEQLRSRSRFTAMAWVLCITLLLCPAVGIWDVTYFWVSDWNATVIAQKGRDALHH